MPSVVPAGLTSQFCVYFSGCNLNTGQGPLQSCQFGVGCPTCRAWAIPHAELKQQTKPFSIMVGIRKKLKTTFKISTYNWVFCVSPVKYKDTLIRFLVDLSTCLEETCIGLDNYFVIIIIFFKTFCI